jgi:hypothetical protein
MWSVVPACWRFATLRWRGGGAVGSGGIVDVKSRRSRAALCASLDRVSKYRGA